VAQIHATALKDKDGIVKIKNAVRSTSRHAMNATTKISALPKAKTGAKKTPKTLADGVVNVPAQMELFTWLVIITILVDRLLVKTEFRVPATHLLDHGLTNASFAEHQSQLKSQQASLPQSQLVSLPLNQQVSLPQNQRASLPQSQPANLLTAKITSLKTIQTLGDLEDPACAQMVKSTKSLTTTTIVAPSHVLAEFLESALSARVSGHIDRLSAQPLEFR